MFTFYRDKSIVRMDNFQNEFCSFKAISMAVALDGFVFRKFRHPTFWY